MLIAWNLCVFFTKSMIFFQQNLVIKPCLRGKQWQRLFATRMPKIPGKNTETVPKPVSIN